MLYMARTYRFFLRHLVRESLPVRAELPLRLTENLEPDIFYQLVKVLRVSAGDKVVLLPGNGSTEVGSGFAPGGEEYEYEVESAQKKEVILRFTGRRKNENELDFPLELLLCMPNKPDKLELILQKAVEIGAAAVTLVEGDFSRMKHNLRTERLEKIMTEAAEQSERAFVPGLTLAGKLRDHLNKTTNPEKAPGSVNDQSIFTAMERSESTKSLPELIAQRKTDARNGQKGGITILVGPEGGFSPEEKALIEELGLPCFSLGRRILRMETAAIVSLGMAAGL
jgi:16S rRNA (uracil1498-N3)-methyltransferase